MQLWKLIWNRAYLCRFATMNLCKYIREHTPLIFSNFCRKLLVFCTLKILLDNFVFLISVGEKNGVLKFYLNNVSLLSTFYVELQSGSHEHISNIDLQSIISSSVSKIEASTWFFPYSKIVTFLQYGMAVLGTTSWTVVHVHFLEVMICEHAVCGNYWLFILFSFFIFCIQMRL